MIKWLKRQYYKLFPVKLSPDEVTPYLLLGKDEGIQRLVTHFYDIMDSSPEAKNCRALHRESLDEARDKLNLFLRQWLGGPTTYSDRYGHPRMRMRHLPFKIGETEVREWLWCMNSALDQLHKNQNVHPELDQYLRGAFEKFAWHMKNQESSPSASPS